MYILIRSILTFIDVINFLIIARALFSWFSRDYSNQIYKFLYQITEPILSPFRTLQHKIGIEGMIDFSPILAIVALRVLSSVIASLF